MYTWIHSAHKLSGLQKDVGAGEEAKEHVGSKLP